MHRFPMKRQPGFSIALVTALAIAFHGFREANGQQLRLQDLPGYQHYQSALKIMRRSRSAETPSDYHWSTAQDRLYFSLGSDRFQFDLESGSVSKAQDEPERAEASDSDRPRRRGVARARQRTQVDSPDGRWRAVYRDFNVHLEPADQRGDVAPQQITDRGESKFRFGTACWVYGEELNQNDAMWFSPDSRKLAFYEIDERHMKTYYLTANNTGAYTQLLTEQYPKAGEKNPHVALLIYDVEDATTTRVQVQGPPDQYIYDVRFAPGGQELLFNRTNRWQNQLDVMAADVKTGETRVVVSETQETWQNNAPLLRFLDDGQRFIWETERTGWRQFELRQLDGKRLNPLSPEGSYPCHQMVHLDEQAGWLYFSASSGEHPLNRHLHRVRLDGSGHQRLTPDDGFTYSRFEFSPDHHYFVARGEAIDTPPSYGVFAIQGSGAATELGALVADDPASAADTTDLQPPPVELFSFPADDGKTTLYGTLHKPIHFDPQRKYPLLVSVYGGPSSSGVSNRYQVAQPQCQFGFVIAKFDNRGTVGRGKAFESANYLKLGRVDLDDQAAGVRYLAQRDYIDEQRVGIFGTSYGGYLSALALLRYPDTFHVAVAGAPVTDWKNYDTIYTERYMRTPQENPEGYQAGSCLTHAENLQGKLYLMHGLVDDNVHPANTWQLAEKLQAAGKRFDMMIYPNSAHGGFANSTAVRLGYFIEHLHATPVELPTEEPAPSTKDGVN